MIKKTGITFLAALVLIFSVGCSQDNSGSPGNSDSDIKAILVEGTGTYTRKISTESELAQKFFDQGLRYAWAFHFPESIASY